MLRLACADHAVKLKACPYNLLNIKFVVVCLDLVLGKQKLVFAAHNQF